MASYKLKNQMTAEILATYAGEMAPYFTWICFDYRMIHGYGQKTTHEYISCAIEIDQRDPGGKPKKLEVTITMALNASKEVELTLQFGNDKRVVAIENLADPDGIKRMNTRVAGLIAGFGTGPDSSCDE